MDLWATCKDCCQDHSAALYFSNVFQDDCLDFLTCLEACLEACLKACLKACLETCLEAFLVVALFLLWAWLVEACGLVSHWMDQYQGQLRKKQVENLVIQLD